MNPEIRQKWLEALRSGKYQQGRRALRTADDKYCCLGVLCELIAPERWTRGSYLDTIGPVMKHGDFFESMPGRPILDSAGLSTSEAEYLASMNDDGETFETIANYIEEKL